MRMRNTMNKIKNECWKVLLAVCALNLFPLLATAQETVSFTVDEAVAYARKNSKTLKSSDIDLEIKKRTAKYSWNVFMPTVQTSATLARQNSVDAQLEAQNASIESMNSLFSALGAPVPASPTVKETESMHWAAMGNVGVSLNLSLAYFEQIQAAKSDYESGLISYQQSIKETETNVKKLFYGLLLQQENIKVKELSLENARRRNTQSRANWDNGLVPELAYLQAYVAYENQKPEVAEAKRLLNQQLDTFAFLLGLPVGTRLKLVGSVEPEYIDADSEQLLASYGNGTLQMQSLDSTKQNLQHNLKALNLSLAPALAFSWNWQPTLTNAFDTEWGDSDNWSDSGSFSATLAWNITNLLPSSSTRVQAANLKDNIRKLELSMQTVQENQKMEVRKAVDTLNTAREQIDAMSRSINLAERSYTMLEQSYEAGNTELLELRDAESQLNQTKLGLLSQKYNYICAVLDLEQILNINLGVAK